MFIIEEVLTKKDSLIVIIDDEPNDAILTRIKYLYDHDGIFVVIHNIHRLQFNILNHTLVPAMKPLNQVEEKAFLDKFQVRDKYQLPEISRFDPQALVVCLRPGTICHIQRPSITAMVTDYYRICV
jgi:DNA-directed RNA polymerase subunit H (RpoH/RPB5)